MDRMSISPGLRFLRPYLCKDVAAPRKLAYLRFFSTSRCLNDRINIPKHDDTSFGYVDTPDALKGNANERLQKLEAAGALKWPRVQPDEAAMTVAQFNKKFSYLHNGKSAKDSVVLIRAIFGRPHATAHTRGELSIECLELPLILSPSISFLPRIVKDPEARIRNRHLDMLMSPLTSQTFRIRSHIIQCIRNFLIKDSFLETQTPILADSASGAIARPFTTSATEFPDKQLALRVAPEIWLKRLVIGGMDRVFEIGPAFRNEGLDATHNPEFTTCEFYKSFATLDELMSMTEKMVAEIAALVADHRTFLHALPEPDANLSAPFKRIEFIPAIEEALGETLPCLTDKIAKEELLALCEKHSINMHKSFTLPRILDKLASLYIEPKCDEPTFIIHHPACMAPLAKSFMDLKTKQVVSARAELFIKNREMANMYEEENSPIEQRQKFVQQADFKDDENKALVDESYIEALEYGLPPTGGWGCGIDRLVMLFSGAKRISDVLPFGTLKNVVNLGNPAPRTLSSAKTLEVSQETALSKAAAKKIKRKGLKKEKRASLGTDATEEADSAAPAMPGETDSEAASEARDAAPPRDKLAGAM
ncbi:Lysine--tRNA ligase [Lachnellula suecica]|uniref:Lysine--tRNA ligase n=1 Tax=Lachnellula suecica TaxID=602035 RepID=A0A8T9BVR1_9HELO|nr:Lysine--tRNA ligase [Lachnellula suecica]